MTRAAALGAALLLSVAAALPVAARAAQPIHAPVAATSAPNFAGVGPLRFGMTDAQMRKAWGKPLFGGALPGDPNGNACYYLLPHKDGRALMFMVAEGRFARVDVTDRALVAPGGGHVGMRLDALRKLYAGRAKASANVYDAKATDLRVTAPTGQAGLLLFETNARGVVTAWRIGMPTQVNYVEGCG